MGQNVLKIALLVIGIVGYLDNCWCETPPIVVEEVSTVEPDAAPGCNAPDIRFTKPRKISSTTEQPFAEFETTQIYLPEDFTTSDVEFVEKIDIDLSGHAVGEDTVSIINPYQFDLGGGGIGNDGGDKAEFAALHESDGEITTDGNGKRNLNNIPRRPKKRRSGGRRRQPHENGQNGRNENGRGSRYKRQVKTHDGIIVNIGKWKNPIPESDGDIYYVDIDDLLVSKSLNKSLKKKLHKLKKPKKKERVKLAKHDRHYGINPHDLEAPRHRRDLNGGEFKFSNDTRTTVIGGNLFGEKGDLNTETDDFYTNSTSTNDGTEADNLQRVKRKSGKTTGALSRPKGGGDSSSKSTSRKGEKAGVEDNDGTGYAIVHPEEEEDEESSEEEDEDAHTHFGDVTEIQFPGEVGPLGVHRLCKIRCVKGKWVGPLCATNEEDEHGNTKFTPLYKSCHVNRIPPHLLLSYRNISVNVGWDLPHGHSLQARCKDLGLYKLLGESRVLCSNGLWAPRMPSCVPTTLLTNFSDDSPPSIKIKIGTFSGAFEPSGVLAVLPGSTIHLDCMYPRRRGTPEWTWTSWYMQYYTDRDHLQSIEHDMTSRFRSMSALKRTKSEGWSSTPDERATKYRLTIKDIQNSDSGTFTCASPRGLTNSIPIIVATSQCPQLPEPVPPLLLRLEGNKLGQRALYRCPLGYNIEGTVNSTCLASGNWSSPPPTCQAVQCPPLYLEDSHLSLTELNTSAWGRAVFKCQWGFKLNGPPGLECEPNGVWSGPVPRCRAIQCPPPQIPLNGRIDGTSSSGNLRRNAVGALVTFSCNEGHILSGEASIVCTEIGIWSHHSPLCKPQCPYPGDPQNGLIAPLKFHYDPGDFLSVQCRPGFVEYSSTGPLERPKCLPDGVWSQPVPQCRSYEEV